LMPGAWVVSQVALGGADRTQPADLESAGQPRASMGACRSRNDGCASSRHMRRYREPFPVLLRPAIGVAPVRLLSVRRGVTGRREVAHDADLYIMHLQILDRHRLRGLLKEGGAVDQRFVGI